MFYPTNKEQKIWFELDVIVTFLLHDINAVTLIWGIKSDYIYFLKSLVKAVGKNSKNKK